MWVPGMLLLILENKTKFVRENTAAGTPCTRSISGGFAHQILRVLAVFRGSALSTTSDTAEDTFGLAPIRGSLLACCCWWILPVVLKVYRGSVPWVLRALVF